MNINILCENQVAYTNARTCRAEWGLSLFIEHEGRKVLLDTGHTDIYWTNAKNMRIDLQKTDFVILSHYHWDHVGGLKYHHFKEKKKLIAHPDIIRKIPKKEKSIIESDFDAEFHRSAFEFLPEMIFLGEIPRKTSFESGMYKNEQMMDDTAIAIKTSKGLVVVTGCSHSGICNICEYAKEVAQQDLYAVVGGFHLTESDVEAVDGTIDYFQNQKNVLLYPMHCVDFATMCKFRSVFNIDKMSSGDKIIL